MALETLKRIHEEETVRAVKAQALLVAELKEQHEEEMFRAREGWHAKLDAALAEREQLQEGQTAFRQRLLSRRAPKRLEEELGEPTTAAQEAPTEAPMRVEETATEEASADGGSPGSHTV